MNSKNTADESGTEVFPNLDYPLDSRYQGSETMAFPTAGQPTSDPVAPLPFGDDADPGAPNRTAAPARGTTDLALFVARIVVGLLAGLQIARSMFGFLGGGGIDATSEEFTRAGFSAAEALTIGVGIVGLGAAVLLLIGLLTPLATAALFAILSLGIVIEYTLAGSIPLFSDTGPALETAVLYLTLLFVLLFAGPGRWAIDRRWSWSYRPRFSGFLWLLIAVLALAAVWLLLNGGNPFSGLDTTVVPLVDEN